jgi:hypothetical protein
MDVDLLFNTFLNNYFRIFYTSFPLPKIIERGNNNYWITTNIRISCNHKKHIYLLSRDSNDIGLMKYYKQYCKILSSVSKDAKRSIYNNQVTNSAKKMKAHNRSLKVAVQGPDFWPTPSTYNLEYYKIRNK